MEYAIIRSGGKQYYVTKGSEIEVDLLPKTPENPVIFDVLLYVSGDGKVKIGKPLTSGIIVKGKVLGEKKTKKIYASLFMAKSRHRRVVGHKSVMSQVKIEQIGSNTDEPKTKSVASKPAKSRSKS